MSKHATVYLFEKLLLDWLPRVWYWFSWVESCLPDSPASLRSAELEIEDATTPLVIESFSPRSMHP